jgi:hypothetical protein
MPSSDAITYAIDYAFAIIFAISRHYFRRQLSRRFHFAADFRH